MILTQLSLNNFGVFHGRQTIKLAPQRGRPIILIGGKNGAGKTTLLDAIKLCFYGPHGFDFRSKDDYLKYLESKVHSSPTSILQPLVASVEVEFQYSDIDAVHTYKVGRSWERRNTGKLQEFLTIERDGKPLDEIASEYWPDFVRDLIPPGVAQLFFFDGEKIQHLADDSSDQRELAEAIKALLGLDIVERLETDLSVFRSRAIKILDNASGLEIDELEEGLKHLASTLEELKARRVDHQNTISALRVDLVRVQNKITSQGGAFARNRERLIHDRAVLQTSIGHLEDDIRSMSAGLLPFVLIPELCEQLKAQLLSEQIAAGLESGKVFLAAAKSELSDRLAQAEFWQGGPKTTPALRNQIKERIDKVLSDIASLPDNQNIESIHQLSASSTRQLVSWIDAAGELKDFLPQHGNELERLHRDLHRVESEIRKIPGDDVLKPFFEEMQRANEGLVEAGKAALLVDEKIKTVELELSTLRNKYEQSLNKLAAQTRQGSQVQLVPKIHQVLGEFKAALLCKKLLQLQNVVTNSFNALCRKKDSVREISINPEDFSVSFKGKDDLPLAKSQLSAGEKQIYAISMLWGLAKSSGRPLPIVIDTPLGRLDTDHRRLLTEHYFPFASHQVVILSTDSEIDQMYFRDLRRSISQAYRLDFDNEENGTTINDGYFWDNTNETN